MRKIKIGILEVWKVGMMDVFPSPLTGEGSGEGEHRSSPSPSLLPPREEKYVGEFLLEKERS